MPYHCRATRKLVVSSLFLRGVQKRIRSWGKHVLRPLLRCLNGDLANAKPHEDGLLASVRDNERLNSSCGEVNNVDTENFGYSCICVPPAHSPCRKLAVDTTCRRVPPLDFRDVQCSVVAATPSHLVQYVLHDGQKCRRRTSVETPFLAESVVVVVEVQHHLFFLRQPRCLCFAALYPTLFPGVLTEAACLAKPKEDG